MTCRAWPLLLLVTACLPRDNPFDRAHVADALDVGIHSQGTSVTIHFKPLEGNGLQGHRVYREDGAGDRVLVAEIPLPQDSAVDDGAADAKALAETRLAEGTLWWRVSGYTDTGEGPLSTRTDAASTRALPDTRIEPAVAPYISGQAGVAIMVQAVAPAAGGQGVHHFRYRFRGREWNEPMLLGPLVLTGLEDGHYTLEVVAEADNGDLDLTPAMADFTYDFFVPEGTTCDPAVCSAGLVCIAEPVGRFCRRECMPGAADAGPEDGGSVCPVDTTCRPSSGDNGEAACLVTAALTESCADRLCLYGLTCVDTGDARSLCATSCAPDGTCPDAQTCVGAPPRGCLPVSAPGSECGHAACTVGFACEQLQDPPVCRRICQTSTSCNVGEVCQALGRGELRVCR